MVSTKLPQPKRSGTYSQTHFTAWMTDPDTALGEHLPSTKSCTESILNFHEVPVGQTWRRNKMASPQPKPCMQKNYKTSPLHKLHLLRGSAVTVMNTKFHCGHKPTNKRPYNYNQSTLTGITKAYHPRQTTATRNEVTQARNKQASASSKICVQMIAMVCTDASHEISRCENDNINSRSSETILPDRNSIVNGSCGSYPGKLHIYHRICLRNTRAIQFKIKYLHSTGWEP